MVRTFPVANDSTWLFGMTIAFGLVAVALVAAAGYCAWMRMPVLATHAAAGAVILCRRMGLMLVR